MSSINNSHINKCQVDLINWLECETKKYSYVFSKSIHHGKREVFIEGNVTGIGLKCWIYEDGAELVGNGIDRRYEKYDFENSSDLKTAFQDDFLRYLTTSAVSFK